MTESRGNQLALLCSNIIMAKLLEVIASARHTRGLQGSKNLCSNPKHPEMYKPEQKQTCLLLETWDTAHAEPRNVGPESGQETQIRSVPIVLIIAINKLVLIYKLCTRVVFMLSSKESKYTDLPISTSDCVAYNKTK